MSRSSDVFTAALKRRKTTDSEPPPLSNHEDKHHLEESQSLPPISTAMSFLNGHSPSTPEPRCGSSANARVSSIDYTGLLSLNRPGESYLVSGTPANKNHAILDVKLDPHSAVIPKNLPTTPNYNGLFSRSLPLAPSPPSYAWTKPTQREAILMRYFVEHLAEWFDICDPEHHFATIVPQRARNCPPLLNAIFTVSTRHLARLRKYRSRDGVRWCGNLLPDLKIETAIHYQNESITHLIHLSMDPEQVHNEDLLAAAVILRFYEEVDSPLREPNEDPELFLYAINIFINAQMSDVPELPYTSPINSISGHVGGMTDRATSIGSRNPNLSPTSPSSSGLKPPSVSELLPRIPRVDGLRQAAFWVGVRQEIHSAFMKQRPLAFPLERCNAFRSLSPAEDAVWADRLVIFCADVVQFCHSGDAPGKGKDKERERWEELKATERTWCKLLPSSFEPTFFRPAYLPSGDIFPMIWFLAPCHVVGVQHIELARILLGVYNPTMPRLGPGSVAAMDDLRADLKTIVLRLCGIALSNRKTPPALVMASMGIAMCGEYFTNRIEQEALLGVLNEAEIEHAWPTNRTVEALKSAWKWT